MIMIIQIAVLMCLQEATPLCLSILLDFDYLSGLGSNWSSSQYLIKTLDEHAVCYWSQWNE